MNYLIYTPDRKRHQFCESRHEVYMTAREWLPQGGNLSDCLLVYDMQTQETTIWHRSDTGLLMEGELE